MGKAYKCDRCGALFEKYEGKSTSMYYGITNSPNTSGCLDLCKECVLELQKWFEEGKGADNDAERNNSMA